MEGSTNGKDCHLSDTFCEIVVDIYKLSQHQWLFQNRIQCCHKLKWERCDVHEYNNSPYNKAIKAFSFHDTWTKITATVIQTFTYGDLIFCPLPW